MWNISLKLLAVKKRKRHIYAYFFPSGSKLQFMGKVYGICIGKKKYTISKQHLVAL